MSAAAVVVEASSLDELQPAAITTSVADATRTRRILMVTLPGLNEPSISTLRDVIEVGVNLVRSGTDATQHGRLGSRVCGCVASARAREMDPPIMTSGLEQSVSLFEGLQPESLDRATGLDQGEQVA